MSVARKNIFQKYMSRGMPNIPNWVKIRKRIIERDKWRCRICHSDMDLNVHHIDYERSNNQDHNLVTLCRPCHKGVHDEGYKPYLFEDWPIPWGEIPRDDE